MQGTYCEPKFSAALGRGQGTAFWAHIGGFVAGLVGIKLFVRRNHLDAHTAVQWRDSVVIRLSSGAQAMETSGAVAERSSTRPSTASPRA